MRESFEQVLEDTSGKKKSGVSHSTSSSCHVTRHSTPTGELIKRREYFEPSTNFRSSEIRDSVNSRQLDRFYARLHDRRWFRDEPRWRCSIVALSMVMLYKIERLVIYIRDYHSKEERERKKKRERIVKRNYYFTATSLTTIIFVGRGGRDTRN